MGPDPAKWKDVGKSNVVCHSVLQDMMMQSFLEEELPPGEFLQSIVTVSGTRGGLRVKVCVPHNEVYLTDLSSNIPAQHFSSITEPRNTVVLGVH